MYKKYNIWQLSCYSAIRTAAAMNSQYLEEKGEELKEVFIKKDTSFHVKTELLTQESQRQIRSIETSDKKLWPKSVQISGEN